MSGTFSVSLFNAALFSLYCDGIYPLQVFVAFAEISLAGEIPLDGNLGYAEVDSSQAVVQRGADG